MHNFIVFKFTFYPRNLTFCSYSFPIEIIGNNRFQHGIFDCCKPVVSVFAMILSFSNNFNTSTPGGMAWTKIGEVKHEYLPQVVMAADFDKAWADYMDAYNACKPEDFISELQAELDSRMELAAKFK